MAYPVHEVKRHLDGRQQVFQCQGLALTPRYGVVAFVSERDATLSWGTIPKGTTTYGFFWSQRPYILYRFVSPAGVLYGHRFDVVERVRLGPDSIEYADLLLDLFVGRDGVLRWDDEDEVADYAARGLLTNSQRQRIEKTKAFLLARHREVIREAEKLLEGLTADGIAADHQP